MEYKFGIDSLHLADSEKSSRHNVLSFVGVSQGVDWS
jgi:hypothetical protein